VLTLKYTEIDFGCWWSLQHSPEGRTAGRGRRGEGGARKGGRGRQERVEEEQEGKRRLAIPILVTFRHCCSHSTVFFYLGIKTCCLFSTETAIRTKNFSLLKFWLSRGKVESGRSGICVFVGVICIFRK